MRHVQQERVRDEDKQDRQSAGQEPHRRAVEGAGADAVRPATRRMMLMLIGHVTVGVRATQVLTSRGRIDSAAGCRAKATSAHAGTSTAPAFPQPQVLAPKRPPRCLLAGYAAAAGDALLIDPSIAATGSASRMNSSAPRSGSMWLALMNAITLRPVSRSISEVRSSLIAP